MDTRERILDTALALFAQKGFRAATVRDIAAGVGVKDSSLYFHYPNKRAILDAILARFAAESERLMAFLEEAVRDIAAMTDDTFVSVTAQYVRAYLLDGFISRCIMLLEHEQGHDARMREAYMRWCIEEPVSFQAKLIARLQRIGYLREGDARMMAVAYYAPLFLYLHLFVHGPASQAQPDAFCAAAIKSSGAFLGAYRKEGCM